MSLPLGSPLPPDSRHAISVSIPLWAHVVGYEEGDPEVLAALACGYPRFFVHPLVTALAARLKSSSDDDDARELAVSPTRETADRLRAFLLATARNEGHAVDDADVAVESVRGGVVHAVRFPTQLAPAAKQFWQHSGEIVSSRHAELVLKLLDDDKDDEATKLLLRAQHTPTHAQLRERVASLYAPAVAADDVFVYPTGMGAIFASVRLLHRIRPGAKSILFGFPYVDTLKILSRAEWCANGVYFFPVCDEKELREAEAIVQREQILAVYTEFPGNPLLSTPDLRRLARIAHANGTVLVVDDTVGSYNVDVMQHASADIVTTSLSKIFSGTCDVMGGSVVLNPAGPFYAALKRSLPLDDAFIVEQDARALLEDSADVLKRLAKVNSTTSAIVQRLSAHPLVQSLFYPELTNAEGYSAFLKAGDSSAGTPRFGPLFSVVLKGGLATASAFYDALDVAKGPSLGTNFTICCPYTLLAHYNELDFAEACGVDRNLLRFSVGLEDAEALWAAIDRALHAATDAYDAAK